MTNVLFGSLHIGPEKNFCYAVICKDTGACALIDPAFEFDRVLTWAQSLQKSPPVRVEFLLATHGHRDHAGGFSKMLERVPQAKVVAHENERGRLERLGVDLHRPLKDGEEFKVGSIVIKALHTPGHTAGGCCYICHDQIFTGDTLFVGQCGRTDLEGGSDEDLFTSLQRLKGLPSNLVVRPGHDYGRTPTSTIGIEAATNPTMLVRSVDEFRRLP